MTQTLLAISIPALAILIGIIDQHAKMTRVYNHLVQIEQRLSDRLTRMAGQTLHSIKGATAAEVGAK